MLMLDITSRPIMPKIKKPGATVELVPLKQNVNNR
ncbi:hypothetical protein ABIB94_008818 [Bradyrhizobium sp. JR7.2]